MVFESDFTTFSAPRQRNSQHSNGRDLRWRWADELLQNIVVIMMETLTGKVDGNDTSMHFHFHKSSTGCSTGVSILLLGRFLSKKHLKDNIQVNQVATFRCRFVSGHVQFRHMQRIKMEAANPSNSVSRDSVSLQPSLKGMGRGVKKSYNLSAFFFFGGGVANGIQLVRRSLFFGGGFPLTFVSGHLTDVPS